jgi:hypothetical protein
MAKGKSGEARLANAELAMGKILEPLINHSESEKVFIEDRSLKDPYQSEEESKLQKLELDNRKLQIENDRLSLENRKVNFDVVRLWVEMFLRVCMAAGLFYLVWLYIWHVLDIVKEQKTPDKLSDTVMSVLLGTTSLNVIGLLATVATYLFPSSKLQQHG